MYLSLFKQIFKQIWVSRSLRALQQGLLPNTVLAKERAKAKSDISLWQSLPLHRYGHGGSFIGIVTKLVLRLYIDSSKGLQGLLRSPAWLALVWEFSRQLSLGLFSICRTNWPSLKTHVFSPSWEPILNP